MPSSWCQYPLPMHLLRNELQRNYEKTEPGIVVRTFATYTELLTENPSPSFFMPNSCTRPFIILRKFRSRSLDGNQSITLYMSRIRRADRIILITWSRAAQSAEWSWSPVDHVNAVSLHLNLMLNCKHEYHVLLYPTFGQQWKQECRFCIGGWAQMCLAWAWSMETLSSKFGSGGY